MKYLFALLIAVSLASVSLSVASAGVGDQEICASPQSGTSNKGTDTSDADAQTFTTTAGFVLGGVKLNLFRAGSTDTNIIEISITETTGGTPAPDTNNTLGTETLDVSTLPDWGAVNAFSCSKTTRPEQLIEFDPPITLASSTTYAIVIQHDSGSPASGDIVFWPYTSADDNYAGGNAWECNAPGSCTIATPLTWDLVLSPTDYGFAVYDNIVDPDEGVSTFDSWILNALSEIGLNSPAGRIFAGVGATGFFFIALVLMKIPSMYSLGIAGFVGGAATLGSVLEPWMMLAVVAIVGISIIIMIYGMFTSGSGSDG